MPTITVNVPEDLKKRMDAHDTVNWSAVARNAFEKQLESQILLHKIRELTKDSTMTEEDAITLGRELKKRSSSKFLESWKKYEAAQKSYGKLK
jgi:hypothetical protein